MSILKIAIQKGGRLSEDSLRLLEQCGIKIPAADRKLKAAAGNFPLEVLFLRDDDIPQYVEQGIADIGIAGENVVLEKNKQVRILEKLGFAACRMSLAIPKDMVYTNLQFFNNKKIATSYPAVLASFFAEKNISAEIEEIGGSVEIAPGIGLSHGIFDIVSSGSTLIMNGLKEVEEVMRSEAVLIGSPELSEEKNHLLRQLCFRINAVKSAAENKYIILNAPADAIAAISSLLPGIKSPSVMPLAKQGWYSMHSVIKEDKFWEVTGRLKAMGAEGILVLPIEKMIN